MDELSVRYFWSSEAMPHGDCSHSGLLSLQWSNTDISSSISVSDQLFSHCIYRDGWTSDTCLHWWQYFYCADVFLSISRCAIISKAAVNFPPYRSLGALFLIFWISEVISCFYVLLVFLIKYQKCFQKYYAMLYAIIWNYSGSAT